jgi:hypothetical protein
MNIYDGPEWTDMRWALKSSRQRLNIAARLRRSQRFLGRSDNVDDVARKCEELGLKVKGK